jgi:hypothetical protein
MLRIFKICVYSCGLSTLRGSLWCHSDFRMVGIYEAWRGLLPVSRLVPTNYEVIFHFGFWRIRFSPLFDFNDANCGVQLFAVYN